MKMQAHEHGVSSAICNKQVYSFGVLMFELLSWVAPYEGRRTAEVRSYRAVRHCKQAKRPRPLSNRPAESRSK